MPRTGHNEPIDVSSGQWIAGVRTHVVKSEDFLIVPEQQNRSVLHDGRELSVIRDFVEFNDSCSVRHATHVFRNEWPVFRPATKMTKATAPKKKMVSPGTRSQRSVCMRSVCMNSLLRAYQ